MQLRNLTLLGVAGIAHAASQSPAACAQVSASSASQVATASSAVPTVGAKVAYDCLASVPLNKKDALKLVNSILPYVEWQTTTSYLKSPPSGYQEPGVDLPVAFAEIKNKISNGTYSNEWDFEADLFRTFNLAHDGHFRYAPNLISAALSFTRGTENGFGLVSVSLNGTGLPQIYARGDVEAYVAGAAKSISSISTINGENAATYIENLAQLGDLQDPDAQYNSMFFSKPFGAQDAAWEGYFAGSGRFGYVFPGFNTTLSYQNGSSQTIETVGHVVGDFSGVTSGASFYNKFCSGNAAAAANVPAATTTVAAAPSSTAYTPVNSPTPPGYPTPVITSKDDIVFGYYLNSTANSDVAVLGMLAMESESPAEFQAVIQDFFAEAKAAGKTKLIVDVSSNGGGYILQGYDTFRQLFPNITQDGYTRWRSSEAFQAIAAEFAQALKSYNPKTASSEQIEAAETTLFWKYDYNLTNQQFPSEQNKVGPYQFNGDNFTNIVRWNLNDPLTTINETYGIGMEITGYGDRKNFTQPFAANDVVVLTDGWCASTCTLLLEFLRTQAGVKSIAIGGRHKAWPIQAIGGTKGANNADFSFQQFLAEFAYDSLPKDQQNSSSAAIFKEYLDPYAYNRATDTSINLRDNILPSHLKDQTPAQFLYEPADCRIFYTPDMTVDVTQMWEMAADVAWGNKKCANGGLSNPKRVLTTPPKRVANVPQRITNQKEFAVPEKTSLWVAVNGRKVPA